jgi:outer membrane usher protein FimD/PapC
MNVYRSSESYFNSYSSIDNDKGWSLGISIPIGTSHSVSVQTNSRSNDYSQTLAYSGHDKEKGSNYRIAYDVYEGESNGVSGNYSRDLSAISTSFGGSYKTNSYRQINANLSGTALLSEHGLAYSALNTGESRILIDSGVPDVTIHGSNHEKTNIFGLALVNGVTPYQKSHNTVDFKSLPEDIEVLSSIQSMVLTEGAIGYQKIRARKGQNFLAHLNSKRTIPFGAIVFDDKTEQEIGIVGQNSTAYVAGINIDSKISVLWEENHCQLAINQIILNSDDVVRSVNCISTKNYR